MSRHKKTRQEKVAADLRRQQFVYTLESKNFSTPILSKDKPNVLPISSISVYSYVKNDVLKTFLLTLAISGFQVILFLLLKNHVLKIPGLIY